MRRLVSLKGEQAYTVTGGRTTCECGRTVEMRPDATVTCDCGQWSYRLESAKGEYDGKPVIVYWMFAALPYTVKFDIRFLEICV